MQQLVGRKTEEQETSADCPYKLVLDNDLELTREHYHKPIKHGVV